MPRPDQTPPLPKLPFLVGDLALLAVATFIAATSQHPLTTAPLVAIVGCVALGAILGAIPFLTDYARKQNEALDERQRALEALGATVTASAEQIGIAATGLHEISESVQKNLRLADQLPHKLHEKIGEFTAQLANARADETEELEKSLAELRGSESERLAATVEKIAKLAADLAKLEAAAHKHLTAANDSLTQLASASGKHFSDLATATAAAIAQAQAAASTALDEKLAAADLALSTARIATLAELEAKLTALTSAFASEEKTSSAKAGSSVTIVSASPAASFDAPSSSPKDAASDSRNEPPSLLNERPTEPESTATLTDPLAEAEVFAAPESPAARKRTPKKTVPSSGTETFPPAPIALPGKSSGAISESLAATPLQPADEFVQFSPEEFLPAATQTHPIAEASGSGRALEANAEIRPTPDGSTRLVVTAYIGIGNRLFIRGAGVGLNWEKGVPLQFISIGKWHWEAVGAVTPISYKLYKNDVVECTALGEQILPPLSEMAVTAVF